MSFAQFKVRNKETGEIFTVYAVHCNNNDAEYADYSEILIYDKKMEAFLWDFINGYEPVE